MNVNVTFIDIHTLAVVKHGCNSGVDRVCFILCEIAIVTCRDTMAEEVCGDMAEVTGCNFDDRQVSLVLCSGNTCCFFLSLSFL
jgi:hypothetical protein